MGIVKKEAELGSIKARHEEVRVVPENKASSEMNKPGLRASDEDVSGCDSVTAKGTGGIVTCTKSEMI